MDLERVLGIDPGLQTTGYGILSRYGEGTTVIEAGVIRTSSATPMAKRLLILHKEISHLIREYKPRVVVLEELYTHLRHPRTGILMAQARGVICLAAAQAGLRLVGYPNKRVKKAIVGNGSASKSQVQSAIQARLSLRNLPPSEDVADALALALAHMEMDGCVRTTS